MPTSRATHTQNPVTVPSGMRSRGFAVIVVVMFSVVILITVLSAAFYSAVGTRTGASSDRQSYQALLAAESGLDTFPRRLSYAMAATTNPLTIAYPAQPSSGEATSSVVLGSLASLTTSGASVTLSAQAVTTSTGNKFLRVTSTSALTSGDRTIGTKTVKRDFQPPSNTGGYGNTPAAISGFNSISNSGTSDIWGYDTEEWFGTVNTSPNATLVDSNSKLQLDLTYATGVSSIDTGEKLEITVGGTPYRFNVTGTGTASRTSSATTTQTTCSKKRGCVTTTTTSSTTNTVRTVTLQPIAPTTASASTIQSLLTSGGQTVKRAPAYALTAGLTVASGTASSTLTLDATTGLRVDSDKTVGGTTYQVAQRIEIYDSTGTERTGKITAINGNSVTVDWEPAPTASFTFAANTRVDTTIPALLSRYNITTGGSATNPPDVAPYSSWFPSRELTFQQFFGVNKTTLKGSPGVSVVSSSNFNQNLSNYANRVVFVEVPQNDNLQITGGSGLCGTNYILVVDGDLTLNQSDNCFTGIIYVTGDVRFQGNPSIKGAIVVEGDPPANSSVDTDGDTVVLRGTGSNDFKVAFDPAIIASLGQYIPSSSTYTAMNNWRQQ